MTTTLRTRRAGPGPVARSLTSFVSHHDALPFAVPTATLRCPRCRSTRVAGHGRWRGRRRYRCNRCGRTFNALTGTPLAGLHHPDRWLELAACLVQGLTVRETARRLGVHPSTAFRWRHRLLAALTGEPAGHGAAPGLAGSPVLPGTPAVLGGMSSAAGRPGRRRPLLGGVVEVSEAAFAHSEKGSRRLARPPRRRGLRWVEPWNVQKVYAVVARDRRGRILTAVTGIGRPRSADLVSVLDPVARGSVLCPPRPQDYRQAAVRLGLVDGFSYLARRRVPVRHTHWHRAGVVALRTRLRAWIQRFNGVATRYLHRYLAWYAFLEQAPTRDDSAAADQLLRALMHW